MNTMTYQEDHALIEKAFFGRVWTPDTDPYFDGNWLCNGLHMGGSEWDVCHTPPNYSNRLDLCSRAEDAITDLGLIGVYVNQYLGALYGQTNYYHSFGEWLVRLPAKTRVKAMVAMIRGRGLA